MIDPLTTTPAATVGETVALTLRARARAYARSSAPRESVNELEVLICRLGVERCAIELPLLRGVAAVTGLTPVPCTPRHVAGLMNVRGEVVVVLDLAAVLGLPEAAIGTGMQILLAERDGARVGLLVDEVLGIRRLAADRLAQSPADLGYARGVAEASIVVLDPERALSDVRLDVFEEVS